MMIGKLGNSVDGGMRNYGLIGVFLIVVSISLAQPTSIERKRDPYKWMFGLSWSVINDNEEKLPNLYDVKGSWNTLYFPSRFTVDKYLRKGWSFEGMATYNSYTSSKIINDSTGYSGFFIAGDFHVKYSFYRFMRAKWFEPYLSSGLGFTYRSPLAIPLTPTANLAAGANFWFSKRWGVQLQVMGKLALVSDIYVSRYDYFQYTAGIVYRRQATRKSNNFNKRQHKWTREKQKYKRKNT